MHYKIPITQSELASPNADTEIEITPKNSSAKERLQNTYGQSKTPEDLEFTNMLYEKCDFRKLAPIFLICFCVGIVSHAHVFMFVFQHNKMARCVVPDLEERFTFEQIMDISIGNRDSDNDQYCHYDQRDYKTLASSNDYDYTKIMEGVSDTPATTEVCERIVTKIKNELDDIGDVENMYDYFNLYCEPYSIKVALDVALKYGQLILPIPIAVAGDFKGRKFAFLLAGSIFTAGVLITLIKVVPIIIFGTFLMGTSLILYYSAFVIYIESTNSHAKRHVGLLIHLAISSAKCVEYVMYKTLKNWYIQTIVDAIFCGVVMSLFLVVGESARWVYFRGKKRTAHKMLGEDRSDLPDELLEKKLKSHFAYFAKPAFRKRIVVTYAMILFASSVQYLARSKYSTTITNFYLKLLLDGGFFMALMTVTTYLLMFFIGRRPIIISYFCVSSILGAVLFFNPTIEILYCQLALVMQLSITENCIFFTFYCISESYPTQFRFTAYGILSTAPAFSEICHFHFRTHKIPNRGIYYLPLFVCGSMSFIISNFATETRNYHIPDYPREAVFEKDYLQVVRSIMYALGVS